MVSNQPFKLNGSGGLVYFTDDLVLHVPSFDVKKSGYMSRRPRLDLEGGLYHLITRGVERRDIFHDDGDYRKFLWLLAVLTGLSVATAAAMTPH